jgi:hypothetical protein
MEIPRSTPVASNPQTEASVYPAHYFHLDSGDQDIDESLPERPKLPRMRDVFVQVCCWIALAWLLLSDKSFIV